MILAVYNPFGFSPLAQESVQYLQSIAIMLTRVHHSVQEVMSQTNEMTNRKEKQQNKWENERTNDQTIKNNEQGRKMYQIQISSQTGCK